MSTRAGLSPCRICDALVWPTGDCDTGPSVCYVLVACLFLSPNPVIVFLQLFDMSDAVWIRVRGISRVSRPRPRPHHPPLPVASQGNPLSARGSDRPTACMAASLLLAFPNLSKDDLPRSLLGFLIPQAFFLFTGRSQGRNPANVLALLSHLLSPQSPGFTPPHPPIRICG